MLSVISLIVYLYLINFLYIGRINPYVKRIEGGALPSLSKVDNVIKSTPIRSKFCNFKCDCFFSHSVKNDNICVPIWIKPLGL
jgi:hypothetical protein